MEKIMFSTHDGDERCVKLYFSKSHILYLEKLEDFDDMISQLQKMRQEVLESLENDE